MRTIPMRVLKLVQGLVAIPLQIRWGVMSPCGTVTNSVSVYDLLGRLVASAAPYANGLALVFTT